MTKVDAIDVRALQHALAGFGAGEADGIAGPRTWGALFTFMGASGFALALGRGAALHFAGHGIDANGRRLAHFMGQMAHESAGFRFMREIWGPTAAQRRYEGRADLGNVQSGDGRRFAGRGIIQLTGRSNYAKYAEKTGIDILARPDLAEVPENAVLLACSYWSDRGLNEMADANDALRITKRINGGVNGLQDRLFRTIKAMGVLL